jgi:hypothetical protein
VSAFTAQNFQIAKAPRSIVLLGDARRPEPAQHIIEFPGGAIEVSRCSDGKSYWAHIIINRGQVVDDAEGRESRPARVAASRVDRGVGRIDDLDDIANISQIAVLITTGDSSHG